LCRNEGDGYMKIIIDRFEADVAVCEKEDKSFIDIPLGELPEEVKEGDILVEKDGKFLVDRQATEERKRNIDELMKDMWE